MDVAETTDPALRSWVESANVPGCDFPIQNLPLGVFRHGNAQPRVGIAIGDRVLDVAAACAAGWFDGDARTAAEACAAPSVNALLALGREARAALRAQVSGVLRSRDAARPIDRRLAEPVLIPLAEVAMDVPAHVGDYTDFYASLHHATNVGQLFRPSQPLLPNYCWVPIGYHGRASSIVASGTPIVRPAGQIMGPDGGAPVVAATRRLDFELEVGALIGPGNAPGRPIPIGEADRHLAGICLVNDWSARDVQAWEYQPLGPFLGKSFATSVSPWVVTAEALAPFRVAAAGRPPACPEPLPYLDDPTHRAAGAIDVTLEVRLSTARMRAHHIPPVRLARSRLASLYWTFPQMIAHHTSNGCNLRPGDLLASGTVSGPDRDSLGCLLERTRGGAETLELPTGEGRIFLEDGDEVILRGWCEREGRVRIGMGECRGRIVPAHAAA